MRTKYHPNDLAWRIQTEKDERQKGRYTLDNASTKIAGWYGDIYVGGKIDKYVEETRIIILKRLEVEVRSLALPSYLPGEDTPLTSDLLNSGDELSERFDNYPQNCFVEVEWDKLNNWAKTEMQGLRRKFRKPKTAALKQSTPAVRIPVRDQQNSAILNWLVSNKYNQQKLPVPPQGKAGVKKCCRDHLCENSKQLFSSKPVFDTAWDRLRADGKIKDAK